MFGHKKGAFTDATADRIGRFETAHRGTIFLDEIGELDISCQVKLLRVLQEQTFEMLGDSRPRKVDVRVVSATNVELAQMVREHTFREDLYWRINLINIHLPALRERREDIPLLVRHFASQTAQQNNLGDVEFSADAMQLLTRLPYPGNIRELKNLVERTMLISGKKIITAEDFEVKDNDSENITTGDKEFNTAGMTLEEIEVHTIRQALEKYDGNLSQAAVSLGISRPALYRRMEKHGIKI
jgi:two-component system NtrC family response regulator